MASSWIGGLGCAGSDGDGAAGPPDIILISIDTLRPDHLGAYGYGRDTSPVLDSLAARGATFANAFAQSSWTLPSHVSLMTSTYASVHQVDTERRSMPKSIPTLAQSLQAHGYETTGFVSWIYLAAKFGFARGFDRYHELIPPPELQDSSSKHSVRSAGVVDSVLAWANARDGSAARNAESKDRKDTHRKDAHRTDSASDGRPFFLFVHFFDPHMDYDPPLADARRFDPTIESTEAGSYDALKPYIAGLSAEVPPIPNAVIRRAIDLYDAEIRYTDRELGRLFGGLRRLGLLDRAVIVVTSDHGEEFGEHGSMEGHQWTLYDEVLHVPLLVAAPEVQPGTRIAPIVESIDIAPTLLEWAGIETPPSYQGRSLHALLNGAGDAIHAEGVASSDEPSAEQGSDRLGFGAQDSGNGRMEWEERAFAEIGRFVIRASLRTPEHKLIFTKDTGGTNRLGVPIKPGFELFDLQTDPLERANVYAEEDPVSRRLSDRLRAWAANRGAPPPIVEPELTEEERERLRSVGYIGR